MKDMSRRGALSLFGAIASAGLLTPLALSPTSALAQQSAEPAGEPAPPKPASEGAEPARRMTGTQRRQTRRTNRVKRRVERRKARRRGRTERRNLRRSKTSE